jgi:hypothetical protein
MMVFLSPHIVILSGLVSEIIVPKDIKLRDVNLYINHCV